LLLLTITLLKPAKSQHEELNLFDAVKVIDGVNAPCYTGI